MNGEPASGAASFNREPLWWLAAGQGIIQGIFILLASFNVPITSAQQAAITGLFIVVGTAWGRSKVYAPVDKTGQPIVPVTREQHSALIMHVESDPDSPRIAKTRDELMEDYKRRMKQDQTPKE